MHITFGLNAYLFNNTTVFFLFYLYGQAFGEILVLILFPQQGPCREANGMCGLASVDACGGNSWARPA